MFSLAGASGTADLSKYLFEFRYQHPTGYANGNAALGVIGMLAAFGLSTDRDANPVLAGLFLAVAALLADFALLSQSRGSFIGVAVAAPVFLILRPRSAPGRSRGCWPSPAPWRSPRGRS